MKVLNDLQLPAKLRGALRAARDRIAAEFGWIGSSSTESSFFRQAREAGDHGLLFRERTDPRSSLACSHQQEGCVGWAFTAVTPMTDRALTNQ
jgi:hypothetical protein